MDKFLIDVAEKLINRGESDSPCYISEEEGIEILNYIFEKTKKTYELVLNENDEGDDITYDCYINEDNSMSVRFEY